MGKGPDLAAQAEAIGKLGEALAAPQHVLVHPRGRKSGRRRMHPEEKGQGAAVVGAVLGPGICSIGAKTGSALVLD